MSSEYYFNTLDFDELFEYHGSASQLFHMYDPVGNDLGQRYYPASSGTAYGPVNCYYGDTDIGYLLAKKGSIPCSDCSDCSDCGNCGDCSDGCGDCGDCCGDCCGDSG